MMRSEEVIELKGELRAELERLKGEYPGNISDIQRLGEKLQRKVLRGGEEAKANELRRQIQGLGRRIAFIIHNGPREHVTDDEPIANDSHHGVTVSAPASRADKATVTVDARRSMTEGVMATAGDDASKERVRQLLEENRQSRGQVPASTFGNLIQVVQDFCRTAEFNDFDKDALAEYVSTLMVGTGTPSETRTGNQDLTYWKGRAIKSAKKFPLPSTDTRGKASHRKQRV